MVGLLAVLVLASAVGTGGAQPNGAASPEWSEEVFDRLEDAVEAYNARGEEPGLLEGWFLRDARVNLHVSDEGGSRAVYSLRLDGDARVTDLRRGPIEDPTLRVETMRTAVEQLSTADDVEAEIRRGLGDGRIRVERVFVPFPGLTVAIGVEEVLIGVGGAAIVSLAVVTGGLNSVLSSLRGVLRWVVRLLRGLWRSVSGIGLGGTATLLTILEKLGLLDLLRRFVERLREAVRRTLDTLLGRRDPPSNQEEPEEGGQRQEQ